MTAPKTAPPTAPEPAPTTAARSTAFATDEIARRLDTLIALLERWAPPPRPLPDFSADAFLWHPDGRLQPVPVVSRVDLALLKGIDANRDALIDNTARFAAGFPANNALLWGARGMGKSSLVKAVHGATPGLKLVEISREDIATLPELMGNLRGAPHRFVVLCDDLSFDAGETSYKSLKAVLDGGIEGRPDNVLFYATSNRRHILPRDMIENERGSAINPGDAVEEKVSLSDRFGLWLGFHRCSQDDFLAMVDGYVRAYAIPGDRDAIRREALTWATLRGSRSGRVAWQFVQDLAGRAGVRIGG